jgi:hypothetical protein
VSFVFVIFAMFLLFRDGDRIVARIPDLPVTSVLPVAGAASSFFTVENQVSITALSSQLVRRLMLHVIPCASRLRATAPAVPAR